ncbi:hypothetical protein [Bradyrhizobium sp. CCBAU 51627]|uniref:hypothetical protein n=1 Tax=Bradyrhizobium sp. CCBAU 51627 TaxID=1325088 RepID=UPI002306269A|nr:hypothetical protein [Bradyrhizobium sp. CCBAU 51627]
MQRYPDELNENERRVVRKWRLATLGFYGSILAGLALYAALHWTPEANFASVNSVAQAKLAGASGSDGRAPFRP